jgi:hypothetical protein
MRDGRYVLVSNPQAESAAIRWSLSVSDDGMVFNKMGYLVGGRHVDYPHVIEHGDAVYVAFATAKQTMEVLKVKVADLAKIQNAKVAR